MMTKDEVYREAKEIRERLKYLQDLILKFNEEDEKESIRGTFLESIPFEHLIFGYWWSCIDSPTDHCMYNIEEDPWKDDCLICHEPSERK